MTDVGIVSIVILVVGALFIYSIVGLGVSFWLGYEDDYPILCILLWPIILLLELFRELHEYVVEEIIRR